MVILEEIEKHLKNVGAFEEKDDKILQYQKNKILSNGLYSDLVLKGVREKGFIQFHMDKAKKFLYEMEKVEYTLKGFEDLELSTQILLKAAIKNGVKFEILDREENFIS